MAIKIYKTPQRRDDHAVVSINGMTLVIGDESFDLSDVTEQRDLDSSFVVNPVFFKDGDVHVRVVAPYGADGEPVVEDPMPAVPMPPAPPVPLRPALFATLGVTITDGALTSVEMAAQLRGAYYEPGYLQAGFVDGRIPPNYLVFVQCDVPATTTQYKSEDGFELVFTDANGDPVNPGRLDIQILEVR